MNYEQYKRKRNKVLHDKGITSKKLIKSGDTTKHFHICGMCGKPLCTVVPKSGSIVASQAYYYLNYPSFIHTSICKDPVSCYNRYMIRGK